MPNSNQKEVIDTRILGLIGLEDVFDLDYETYLTLLKEAMVKGRMAKTAIPTEEVELLTNEYKRVKTKKDKGRFEVKPKKITAGSFAVGSVKVKLSGTKSKGLLPAAIGKSPIASSLTDSIATITSAVTSILDTLKAQKALSEGATAFDRKKTEQDKRALAESNLEKAFKGIAKTAEKVIAPVKSLLDKILNFIGTVILGRIVFKIVEWMGDSKNQSKVKSIIRFFSDWGPTLLSLYIVFGTSFGKFARGLISLVIKSTVRLGAAVAGLAVKTGIGKAGGKLSKVAGFLGGRRGKLLAAGLETAAVVGGSMALSNTLKGGGESKAQGLAGGGYVKPRFPTFSGGGFNFKGMMGGASMGAMFGPLGMLLGGAMGGSSGFVSGEKGVDKIPAMLSDGEFVMSRGAVAKYGVDTLEGMNAAGGGTNKPKIMSGTAYAKGGGLIGENPDPNYKDPVLDGRLNLMKSIENYAKSQASAGGDMNIIKSLNNLALALKGGSSRSYGGFMNRGAEMQGYLTRGGMQSDLANLGNQAITSLQSNFNTVKDVAKTVSGSIDKIGTGERYKRMSQNNEKKSQEAISKYDAWIQSLPKGFLKDTMNRGLIPIPTGNELGMTGVTYLKSMLGPLGRPFKILSNDVVDKARQEIIDRTAAGNGMRVGPDGKMSMEWNRVGATGSGAYTDELDALGGSKGKGKFFNSTFGRFAATQQGDRMVTNDVYNFNESLGYYAGKSRDALMKGNVGEGLYNIASMAGRFAQDIGWMNQRALGSEVDIGSVKNIDPKTGKPKPLPQSVKMYDKNDPRRKQSGPHQSKFARPKNAGVKPVKPLTSAKPRVMYGPPTPTRRNVRGGGTSSSTTPSFSASTKGMRSKQETLGLMR